MDHPSGIIIQSLLVKAILWRRKQSNNYCNWSDAHLATVHDYYLNLYPSCDFTNVSLPFARLFKVAFNYRGPASSRIRSKIAASLTQKLHQFFKVPRLKKFLEEEHHIKKHQLVKVFLTFLIELLSFKSETLVTYEVPLSNLNKELRFLLTILEDKSSMLYVDEHEQESQNLVAEFEAVANESGTLIHSLLFSSTHRSSDQTNAGFAYVLNHINLLQYNVMRFLNLFPSVSKPAHTTPETSLVDSFILDSLIHDLEDLISREDDFIASVKYQLEVLHQGFTFLQSSVKAAGLPRPSELKEAQGRIGNMAHQTEYLVLSFLSGDAPLWYVINRLTDISQRIDLIGIELQEITEKHNLGNPEVAKYPNMQLASQVKGNIEVKDILVDFNDKRQTDVLCFLMGEEKRLQYISICGMPGLGKTTLAKKLFNHPSVSFHFDIKSWSVVSQNYKRQNVLADILIQINGAFSKESASTMDSVSLVDEIHKRLYGRRYLIVMDDVWDSELWDILVGCLPDNGNGNRILFTTRDKDVGPSDCKYYALSSLSKEESWELLEKKVFGNDTCPHKLIEIGEKIAVDCWGLPLAIVVIAGVLSDMDKDIYAWKEVRGNLSSYVSGGGDSVMQILELSYKNLPDHLKRCFLYFREFHKGDELRVKKLMRLWIAEGFVHKEQGKRAEEVAEEYLKELIDKNLVIVAKKRWDGRVKTCVVHDLFHDLCFILCQEENFLMKEESNIYSIYENGFHHRHAPECCISWAKKLLPSERSLFHLLRLSSESIPLEKPYQRWQLYIGGMRSLRVLHFDYISNYLTGLEYLVNLRYLVITDLPESIACLCNLEYLQLETRQIVYITPAILRMTKLRHLIAFWFKYERNCNSFQPNNLEFLSDIIIREPKDEEMLKCSSNLRKLKCMYELGCKSSNLDLSFLTRLQSLRLDVMGIGMREFSFPSNMRKLSLSGYLKLPWEKMSLIGKLENLEVFKLGMWGFVGEKWEIGEGEFQKLKFLKLDGLEDLVEWDVDSSGLPALQQLVVSDCKNLQEIPCRIGEIATLEMIEIEWTCAESLVESARQIKQEKKDSADEDLLVLVNGKPIPFPSLSPSGHSSLPSTSESE